MRGLLAILLSDDPQYPADEDQDDGANNRGKESRWMERLIAGRRMQGPKRKSR